MELARFLGRHIAELLEAEPFSQWRPVRTVESEPHLEVWYEFEAHGIEVTCDGADQIKTFFLHRGGDGEALLGISFASSREQVLRSFGSPEKMGGASRIPGIGERGAWDRFAIPGGALHVQYVVGADEIELVTLMRADAVPRIEAS